jgi:hypothetical protein
MLFKVLISTMKKAYVKAIKFELMRDAGMLTRRNGHTALGAVNDAPGWQTCHPGAIVPCGEMARNVRINS